MAGYSDAEMEELYVAAAAAAPHGGKTVNKSDYTEANQDAVLARGVPDEIGTNSDNAWVQAGAVDDALTLEWGETPIPPPLDGSQLRAMKTMLELREWIDLHKR